MIHIASCTKITQCCRRKLKIWFPATFRETGFIILFFMLEEFLTSSSTDDVCSCMMSVASCTLFELWLLLHPPLSDSTACRIARTHSRYVVLNVHAQNCLEANVLYLVLVIQRLSRFSGQQRQFLFWWRKNVSSTNATLPYVQVAKAPVLKPLLYMNK